MPPERTPMPESNETLEIEKKPLELCFRQSAEEIAEAHADREECRRRLRDNTAHAAMLEKLLDSRKRFGLLYLSIDAPLLRHVLAQARQKALIARQELGILERASAWHLCGAKTKAGSPCQRPAVAGKRRCRLHGGKSTGPKTEAGREAIRESNRRRAEAGYFAYPPPV